MLVVHREVVHHVLIAAVSFAVYALNAVLDDVRDLVPIGRVVMHNRRVGVCQQRRVAICVLQTFTGQGGASSGGADDEATCHLVGGGPEGVTGALDRKSVV